MSSATHSITVKRTVKASLKIVFDAFSQPNSVAKWFSPSADISIEILEFNFTPKGTYRIRYAMPDGTHPIVGGTYESIERPTQINFTWIWEAPDLHAGISTHVCVHFLEKGAFTEVVLVHTRLMDKDACARHTIGWEANLERLTQYIITRI